MRVTEGDLLDGRYRILSPIGSGGMAEVWLAEDLELSRHVALKILHGHFAGDPEFIDRFRREAESAAALQHNHIVPIFDRGQVGDTYYIAMAWIRGRTLRELINRGLTVEQSVGIVRQILEAAGFAHAHGVVHRDFKPLNVIVEDSGRAVVTDFGIARAGAPDLTETGMVIGTAAYLSPEQAEGLDVGPRSDLYSIGVILYECLTGRVPFEGDTPVAVALKQLSEQPVPPSHINPEVSPALDAVVMKSLQREPSMRFGDANEFIAALDAAMLDPTGGSPAPERKKWPMIVGAIAAVLIALIAWGILRDNTVRVPNVVGLTQDRAINTLSSSGFQLDTVRRIKSPAPSNQVVSQSPRGEADRDCAFFGYFCSNPEIALEVSGGPGQIEVPEVAGLSQGEAEDRLDAAGLEVEVASVPSSEYPEGQATGTDPPAGEVVRSGSQVTLNISSGPSQVVVPPVVGLTSEAARQQLSARGLEISVTEEASDRPAGEAITQSPDAGTRVDPGSTVDVTVSTGPDEVDVTVPNVVGQLRSDGVNTIRGANLITTVVEEPTTILPQDGRVIDQDPAGGTTVPERTTITLTVGVYSP
jgi:serine/threonine protein kinase